MLHMKLERNIQFPKFKV